MTTRKAEDVLKNYTAMLLDIPRKQVIPDSFVGQELTEAQAALCKDLLELLPEKRNEILRGKDTGFARIGSPAYAHNLAIDQMKQAIKQYFRQEDV